MAKHHRRSHELDCGSGCIAAGSILLSYRWTQGARICGEQDPGWARRCTDDRLVAENQAYAARWKIDAVEALMRGKKEWWRTNSLRAS